MKKLFIILIGFLFIVNTASAKGVEEKEIKTMLKTYIDCANKYDMKCLAKLHSDKYINTDGFSKDVYFDLLNSTRQKYPNLKSSMIIKKISINKDFATVEVEEKAYAKTYDYIENSKVYGHLESIADIVYHLKKEQNQWVFVSDYIVNENTKLLFGTTNELTIKMDTPQQLRSGAEYTSSLIISNVPKDSFVIASIGQENIAYPQIAAPEAFRKLSEDGTLERIFKANDSLYNEYSVASIGVTKVIKNKKEDPSFKVTGLAYCINRINVLPQKDYKIIKKGQENGEKEKAENSK